MKHAIVTPIIKKHGMDSSSLSSYRPIYNLPFVFKLLERIVAGQLITYMNTNHLLPTHQSAYCRYHSTETALLAICNDALIAADRGMVTLVVLLDLSAAFDTFNTAGYSPNSIRNHRCCTELAQNLPVGTILSSSDWRERVQCCGP